MSITITPDGQPAINLPDRTLWIDRNRWQPTITNKTVTTTGSQIIQGGTRTVGRPITLQTQLKGSVVAALDAESQILGRNYVIEMHDGTTYTAQWAPGERRIDATTLLPVSNPGPDTYYNATLRFITV